MIVCLCAGVNDRTIRKAMQQGASNLREIGRATGAGMHCGNCRCDLRRIATESEQAPGAHGAEPRVLVLRR